MAPGTVVADDTVVCKTDKEYALVEFHSLMQERDSFFFFNYKDI